MNIIKLIKILANVCKYNANGKLFIRMNGEVFSLDHCEDDTLNGERIFVLVPKEENIPEIDQDIKDLINWRANNSDHWGEDLLSIVAGSLSRDYDVPEKFKLARDKFRLFNNKYDIVRRVLNIKEGEGYDY